MVVDGGLLVLDGGYGMEGDNDVVGNVESQTKGHWNVMRRVELVYPTTYEASSSSPPPSNLNHLHPLPTIATINKLDNPLTFNKHKSPYFNVIGAMKKDLKGCDPLPVQVPVYSTANGGHFVHWSDKTTSTIGDDDDADISNFVGVIDLISMRLITWDPKPKTNGGDHPATVVGIAKDHEFWERTILEVSERSERASRKTRMRRATTKQTLFSILCLSCLPPDPLNMRLASLGADEARRRWQPCEHRHNGRDSASSSAQGRTDDP